MASKRYGQILPLSCDWLSLSLDLRTSVHEAPEGHVWAYYSATNVWASRWVLFNEYGDKVFTLLFQPRSSCIRGSAALIEIANEWLYHGIGIQGCLDLLSQCCDFTVGGMSRLDLAVDFNPTIRQAHIIRGLASGKYYVGGKRNRVPWYSVIRDEFFPTMWQGEIPHDQSWGHKTSDIRWKLYYKSKELRDAAGGKGFEKPYIVDMWREVGLQENNVWRLEVSIRNCNNYTYLGRKLSFEAFMHSTSHLYQTLYAARFQVRRNQGHKDKSNDRVVPLLPIECTKDAFRARRSDVLAKRHGRLALIRHLVADVQKEECMIDTATRETIIAAMESVLNNDRMERYFAAVTGQAFDDWKEWLRVRAAYWGEEYRLKSADEVPTDNQLEMSMLDAGVAWNPEYSGEDVTNVKLRKKEGR